MKSFVLIAAITWSGLWFTPDQQGQRLFNKGEYASAAKKFDDPIWKGVALYRNGDFEDAAQVFARRDSAETLYNQGNAWLMNGKYETAVSCYERALEIRPDWKEASENRDLAAARAKAVKQEGGDLGDQRMGADKIVFDKNKKKQEGQDTEVGGEQTVSDSAVQSMWLRRVQTKPADFLKSKFAFQQANAKEAAE